MTLSRLLLYLNTILGLMILMHIMKWKDGQHQLNFLTNTLAKRRSYASYTKEGSTKLQTGS